jgi:hypothetical protein
MLLPAFCYARLPREQSTEILKSCSLGKHRKEKRSNSNERGSLAPPMHRRNCFPLTQRNTATSYHRPAAGWRQCDRFFYWLINLAKALTSADSYEGLVNVELQPQRGRARSAGPAAASAPNGAVLRPNVAVFALRIWK